MPVQKNSNIPVLTISIHLGDNLKKKENYPWNLCAIHVIFGGEKITRNADVLTSKRHYCQFCVYVKDSIAGNNHISLELLLKKKVSCGYSTEPYVLICVEKFIFGTVYSN